jgi:hypothetical protein
MSEVFTVLVNINWVGGMIFVVLSNPSFIILGSKWEKLVNRKNRVHYSIHDMRKVINAIDDDGIKYKLKRKIVFRKIGFFLLLITPILIIVGNLI